MESPISNTVMMGVVLIALAAVIGMGFGVFVISKDTVNTGTMEVQANIKNMQDINIDTYNDTVVLGRDINSFYENNRVKDLALLINTLSMKEGKVLSLNNDRFLHIVDGIPYINYGCIIGYSAGGNRDESYVLKKNSSLSVVEDSLIKQDGVIVSPNMFIVDSLGNFLRDDGVGEWNKAGNPQYIKSSTKFNANLICNEVGDLMGVMFTQLEN